MQFRVSVASKWVAYVSGQSQEIWFGWTYLFFAGTGLRAWRGWIRNNSQGEGSMCQLCHDCVTAYIGSNSELFYRQINIDVMPKKYFLCAHSISRCAPFARIYKSTIFRKLKFQNGECQGSWKSKLANAIFIIIRSTFFLRLLFFFFLARSTSNIKVIIFIF